MRFLFILFGLCPAIASGGQLYKCVGASGEVTYQASSCGSGQRTVRTVYFEPDPAPPAAGGLATVKPVHTSTRRSAGARQSPARIQKPRPSACDKAKAKREATLQRLGLKRTFDDLSRMDAGVRAACTGF